MESFRHWLESQPVYYTNFGHGPNDMLWFWKGGKFYEWDSSSGIHASAIEQILTQEEHRGFKQARLQHEKQFGEDEDITAEQYLEMMKIPFTKGRYEPATGNVTFISSPPTKRMSSLLMNTLYHKYGPNIHIQGFAASGYPINHQ